MCFLTAFLKHKDKGGNLQASKKNLVTYKGTKNRLSQISLLQQQMSKDNAIGELQKTNSKIKWHKQVKIKGSISGKIQNRNNLKFWQHSLLIKRKWNILLVSGLGYNGIAWGFSPLQWCIASFLNFIPITLSWTSRVSQHTQRRLVWTLLMAMQSSRVKLSLDVTWSQPPFLIYHHPRHLEITEDFHGVGANFQMYCFFSQLKRRNYKLSW